MKSGTIFALASGSGRAGVAVFRLSGPEAGAALDRLTGRRRPPPRRAVLRDLVDPRDGEVVDRGLILWFPGPGSFTGEDVAELHVHGGPAMTARITGLLTAGLGLRLAEPGEFSRRAFENGRLDLTAAEGVADLVAAETEAQRRQAQRQMRGELGALYDDWRDRLLRVAAHLEATIDFADEDVPPDLWPAVRRDIAALRGEIAGHLDDGRRGERLRDGVAVVIVGPPNVGKSSLFNRLVHRDAAIVSEIAGTTRDVIEVGLDLNGYPVTLSDTAGLHGAGDPIEGEGMRRARARARDADLRVVMAEAATWPDLDPDVVGLIDDDSLVVVNKVDRRELTAPEWNGRPAHAISVRTEEGVADFVAALTREVARRCGEGLDSMPLTRHRHREALTACASALRDSSRETAPELVAENVRMAVRALGAITGRVDVEDMLDVVFRDFCIGK